MASLTTLLLPLLALLSLALAQDVELPSVMNGSVFVYEGKETEFGPPHHRQSSDPKIVFALNAERSTGDLFFHLESPKDNQWVGVGIGSSMSDALFLIAYPSHNGSGVTISPRTASGHSEPSWAEDVVVEKVYGDGLPEDANTVTGGGLDGDDDGVIMVDAVCRKCASYAAASNGLKGIDFASTEQPFIFAIGPPLELESDSLSAGIQAHMLYGSFTMDMTATTSEDSASVPLGPYTMSSSTTLSGTQTYNDPGSRIHGIVMVVTFVIIFPLGALLLRVWNVKAHIVLQLIGWILFCMAFAGGAVASKKYNKSKNFASGHQVLGILLLIALFSQWVLGWVHHRTYKKEGRGTIFGKIHLYLGPAVIFLGWINGGLGFRFAGQPHLALPYGILLIIVILIFTAVRLLISRRRRKQAQSGRAPPGMPAFGAYGGGGPNGPNYDAQQQGFYRGNDLDGQYGGPHDAPPPAYGQGGQGINLQQYPSSSSLPQVGQRPAEGRTMV